MSKRKLIDIGANLTDLMYRGVYNGSSKHKPDLDLVLKRSIDAGVRNIIITSGSLSDSRSSLQLIQETIEHKDSLFTTVGVHPTRCSQIHNQSDSGDEYLENMFSLIDQNTQKVVAVGEIGLDYDRTQFCSKDIQISCFEKQLDLVERTKLPMFLHCRNAGHDLIEILERNANRLHGGVVHSFDGSSEEADKFIQLGYHIGLNGCSLKTEANLDVVQKLPLNKILLETDAPWCEIRPTHPSFKYVKTIFPSRKKEKFEEGQLVKGRNEPCNMRQVLEVVAGVKQLEPEVVESAVLENTLKLFPQLV